MENKNEYYAIIDGEEIKVDYCFSNLLGASYCEYNGYIYENVPHRTVILESNNGIDEILNVVFPYFYVILGILFIGWLISKFR